MITLYVTSSESGTGKTAICAGIARHLQDDGRKVGYLKLTAADSKNDADAVFMNRILASEETPENTVSAVADQANLSAVKKAVGDISGGRDVVIIEAAGGDPELAGALDAKVIVVAGHSQDLSQISAGFKDSGKRLLGVVVNKVPLSRLDTVTAGASALLGEAGINLLGTLPEDRVLLALTIGELAEQLGGKILSGDANSAELVENIMLGAMYVGYGPEYFGRKSNKAALIRSERSDMQMAALETSTRCLVITGEAEPKSIVLRRAEDRKTPVLSVKEDIVAAVAGIEEALGRSRFNQDKKLPRLAELMKQRLDFKEIYRGLGLVS